MILWKCFKKKATTSYVQGASEFEKSEAREIIFGFGKLKVIGDLKEFWWNPGWLAQLLKACSPYTKVAGLIPSQGAMNFFFFKNFGGVMGSEVYLWVKHKRWENWDKYRHLF